MCSAKARTLSSPKILEFSPPFLNLLKHRQHRAGIGLFALGGNGGEDFFDRRELLRFVVNDEIAFVAELLDVLA
jgi:hypothetical protein